MKSYVISFGLSLAFSLASPAFGFSLPKLLQFKDQPIDALCFFSQKSSKEVNLKDCGIKQNSLSSKKNGTNTILIQKGFTGYDYQFGPHPAESGYSYYKLVGMVDGNPVLYTLNNTGGTGEFTSLILVNRHQQKISIQTIAMGDRCNHGLVDAKIIKNMLSYSIHMTPYDIASLTSNPLPKIKPYDDLMNCAVCCAGNATYTVTIENNTLLSPQLTEINFANYVLQAPQDGSMPYQTCFDQLIQEYLKKNMSTLNPKTVNQLIKKFNQQCKPS